jgi:hypothetical protein
VDWWELALEVIGWAMVAVIGGVMLTEAVRWSGTRIVATLQALTPLLALLLVPVGAVAVWQGRYLMVAAAVVAGLGALALMAPLVFTRSQPHQRDGTEGLRVALANLLYGNERIDDVAADLAERDLDVIVFNEYTPNTRPGFSLRPSPTGIRTRSIAASHSLAESPSGADSPSQSTRLRAPLTPASTSPLTRPTAP